MGLVASLLASCGVSAFDGDALPDPPVALRLDAVPLRVLLENALVEPRPRLEWRLARRVIVDGSYEGTLHGMLTWLERVHSLAFELENADGSRVLTVREAANDAFGEGGRAPDERPGTGVATATALPGPAPVEASTVPGPEPAADSSASPAASTPRTVDEIPGFETF